MSAARCRASLQRRFLRLQQLVHLRHQRRDLRRAPASVRRVERPSRTVGHRRTDAGERLQARSHLQPAGDKQQRREQRQTGNEIAAEAGLELVGLRFVDGNADPGTAARPSRRVEDDAPSPPGSPRAAVGRDGPARAYASPRSAA